MTTSTNIEPWICRESSLAIIVAIVLLTYGQKAVGAFMVELTLAALYWLAVANSLAVAVQIIPWVMLLVGVAWIVSAQREVYQI